MNSPRSSHIRGVRRFRTADPWLLLLPLVALVLGLYRLDAQSLWADEGTSVALAGRSFRQIAHDSAHDIHPPLYAWTLRIWVWLVGSSPFAIRALSALYGSATVALTYLLGRRWFGERAAVIAAVAATVSPFAIHYSQETRMYALAALLSAATFLVFDRWIESRDRRFLLVYSVLALLYTHYFGVTALAACSLVLLLAVARSLATTRGRDGKPAKLLLVWMAVHVVLGAAYLPWVWNSRAALSAWPAAGDSLGPSGVAVEAARVFSVGLNAAPAQWFWTTCFVLLCLAGVLYRPLCRRHFDGFSPQHS